MDKVEKVCFISCVAIFLALFGLIAYYGFNDLTRKAELNREMMQNLAEQYQACYIRYQDSLHCQITTYGN